MRQFCVLESTDGVTIYATISVDANSPAFNGAELAELYSIDNPTSNCGIRARQVARERIIMMCEDIVIAVSSAEQITSDARKDAKNRARETAYAQGLADGEKEAAEEIAEKNKTLVTQTAIHESLIKDLDQLKQELATFQQSEAQRAHLAQSRRSQRASQKRKSSTTKPAHKRK